MKLVYRGLAFDYAPQPQQFVQPRAMNWRYQCCQGEQDMAACYVPLPQAIYPRAINWRYRAITIM
ncbi:MAG: hypothetical protein IGS48_19645 [Oscillatoriales cyanobacterium C42_A2020_001]|nr:hypothetical protein [Leptolyngbyaceae cyanobacterium C42_A2020_001]